LPEIDDIPAGIYYYDPAHHALIRLRDRSHSEFIDRAVSSCNRDSVAPIFLLTCHFWKNAFFYRNYTYRLCPQEVGILASNIMMVARACGFSSRVHHQFLDSALNKLLGLEVPDESVMAVVSFLGKKAGESPFNECSAKDLEQTISAIMPTFVSTSRYDGSCCRRIEETHAVTMLQHTGDFVSRVTSGPIRPQMTREKFTVMATPDDEPTVDLAEVLRRRSSGMWCFNAVPSDLPAENFWRTLRYTLSPHFSDTVDDGLPPPVDCYIAVNKVHSIDAGIYRLHPSGEILSAIKAGPVAAQLQSLHKLSPPQINYDLMNFVVFLVVDRSDAAARYGNRWLRVVGQEAGVVAQRLVTMCAAVNLTARIHNGYKGQFIADFLELDSERYIPFFQILVGSASPTARFQMPITF
jgi:SagB-type dehydrogenase family enzyme